QQLERDLAGAAIHLAGALVRGVLDLREEAAVEAAEARVGLGVYEARLKEGAGAEQALGGHAQKLLAVPPVEARVLVPRRRREPRVVVLAVAAHDALSQCDALSERARVAPRRRLGAASGNRRRDLESLEAAQRQRVEVRGIGGDRPLEPAALD